LKKNNYLIGGGIWALFGMSFAALSNLLMSVLLARLLPPDKIGVYLLALNVATFFSIITSFGLDNTLLRFVSQALGCGDSSQVRDIVKKGFKISLLSALIIWCVASLVIPILATGLFNSDQLKVIVPYVATWAGLLGMQSILREVLRAFQDIRSTVLYGSFLSVTASALMIYLLDYFDYKISLQVVILIIISALFISIGLMSLVLYKKIKQLPSISENKINYNIIIKHAWPLLLNFVMVFVLTQSDIWILGAFGSKEGIAIYGVAARLVLLTTMPLLVANAILPPLIARMHAQDDNKSLERLLQSVATLTGLPAFIFLLIFNLWASELMGLFYGDYYKSGGVLLVILGIGQIVNVLVGSCGYTLIMTGHQRTMLVISIVSTCIAVYISITTVADYGVVGVACAYSGAMVFQQLAMLFSVRVQCGIWTNATFKIKDSWIFLKAGLKS
jgi:O-antigen/teichoic acid export membrane protein